MPACKPSIPPRHCRGGGPAVALAKAGGGALRRIAPQSLPSVSPRLGMRKGKDGSRGDAETQRLRDRHHSLSPSSASPRLRAKKIVSASLREQTVIRLLRDPAVRTAIAIPPPAFVWPPSKLGEEWPSLPAHPPARSAGSGRHAASGSIPDGIAVRSAAPAESLIAIAMPSISAWTRNRAGSRRVHSEW